MICLNTKRLKDGMDIQNNVLYRIDGNKTVSIREEHGDCADVETVSLKDEKGKELYTFSLDIKKNIC